MKLISNRALREFGARNRIAESSLHDWRRLIEKGDCGSFAELRVTFGSVDKVGERYVFDIGGNKYRLVASISFSTRQVIVKAVLTHSDCDKGKWK